MLFFPKNVLQSADLQLKSTEAEKFEPDRVV